MALSKEMILTLTCLKEVGVKGVGPKKIFSIGAIIMDKGLNVEHVEVLLPIMKGMKEKVVKEVALDELKEACVTKDMVTHSRMGKLHSRMKKYHIILNHGHVIYIPQQKNNVTFCSKK